MSEMLTFADSLVVIGKTVSVYGIRGEVEVYLFTDSLDNLLDYRRWTLRRDDETRQAELVRGHLHGKALAAKLKGFGDHEKARTFAGYEICIPRSGLPFLEEGEYYWHQSEGPKVIDQSGQLLDMIDHPLEIGANDVMVVGPCTGSLDDHERLSPYTGQYVLPIDLATGEMRVDQDADLRSSMDKRSWVGVVSIFSEMFRVISSYGTTSRAVKQGLFTSACWNPRDYIEDHHQTADNRSFGGGPGMVMKIKSPEGTLVDAR